MAFLNERHGNGRFELLVLYGRRRVGKTELLRRFVKGRPHLYFLADKRGTLRNALRLRRDMAAALGEPEVAATELDPLFRWFADRAKGRTVMVIDEFPYLVEKDDSIPSVFQLIADEILQDRDIMLILCGSSVSMMERAVLGSKSALYGRRTGHWKVMPLSFPAASLFFPGSEVEKKVEFYSVLGGVPFYLEKFQDSKSTIDNIETEILGRSGRLYEEVDFLLKEELREPDVYKAILEAIGSGRGKAAEIAQAARMAVQDIDKYLKVLIRLGMVSKSTPVTEGRKSKRSRYVLADPLFRFWFTFCEPHKSELELGETARCRRAIEEQLPAFVGKAFEGLCIDLLAASHPGRWPSIGRWWGAKREGGRRVEIELDIVGLNGETNEALFAECKWRDGVDAEALLHELKEKAELVEWRKGRRTEVYAVFAKTFKRKIRQPGLLLFDLASIGGAEG